MKRNLKAIPLKPEVKTRFTATTIMLKSVLNDPNDKTEEEADREKVFANVEAMYRPYTSKNVLFASIKAMYRPLTSKSCVLPPLKQCIYPVR